jgi:hypothetical protein
MSIRALTATAWPSARRPRRTRRGGVLTAISATWLAILNELANVATEERRPVARPASPQQQERGGAMAKRILHRVARKAGVKVRPRFYHWA